MGIRLIAGLGNPGREYADTRHNAGFWWVDAYAAAQGASLRREARFHGEVCRVSRGGAEVWLLKPDTFMNLSGRAVAALARFYRIEPAECLVVHDELDHEPGDARLKLAGGHGGHNGLKSIFADWGSQDFWRLRIGVGRPADKGDQVSWVLNVPRREEREAIGEAITRSLAIAPQLLAGEFNAAMKSLHTRPRPAPESKPKPQTDSQP